MIKLFFKNLLNKAVVNGTPIGSSIATIITAIKEGKYDWKKSLWIFAEAFVCLGVLYATLYIANYFGMTPEQVFEQLGKIMKLGLGN